MKHALSGNSFIKERPPQGVKMTSGEGNNLCCNNPFTQIGEILFLLVKTFIETMIFCYVEWKSRRRNL